MDTVETKRIQLRLATNSDLEAIHILLSSPEVDKYNTLGIPSNLEETKSIIEPLIASNNQNKISNYTFSIEKKSNNQFLGLFGLKLWEPKHKRGEVWYKILPNEWNKGYATETLNAVLDFGFNKRHLHRIQAGCAVENSASIKVLEKVGMTREGRGRQVLPLKSGWSDNFEYSIFESDVRP